MSPTPVPSWAVCQSLLASGRHGGFDLDEVISGTARHRGLPQKSRTQSEEFRTRRRTDPHTFGRNEGDKELSQGRVEPAPILAGKPATKNRRPLSQVMSEKDPGSSTGFLPHGGLVLYEGMRLLPGQEEEKLALTGDVINALVLGWLQDKPEGPVEACQITHLLRGLKQGVLAILGLIRWDAGTGRMAEDSSEGGLKPSKGLQTRRGDPGSESPADEPGQFRPLRFIED